MIRKLQLRFGKGPDTVPEPLQVTPVTVFVGPNNSGKSKVLSEIHRYCANGQRNATDVILDQIEFEVVSAEVADEKIRHVTLKPHAQEAVLLDHVIVGKRGSRQQVNKQNLLQAFLNANGQPHLFCSWYLQYNTMILDGQGRIGLVNQQGAG